MKVSVFNKMSKWGLGLCFISFFAGDILKILGVGFVFQQTAITNAFGFLGLAFVILGGVEALLEAIQKNHHLAVPHRDQKLLENHLITILLMNWTQVPLKMHSQNIRRSPRKAGNNP
jgi:arginine exporter protein ArgO